MKISGTNKHACSLYTEGRKKVSSHDSFIFTSEDWDPPTLISLQLENTDEIKILNSGKLWGSAADSTQFSTHFNSACRTSCDLNDGLMCECLKMKQSMVYLNDWTLDVSPVNDNNDNNVMPFLLPKTRRRGQKEEQMDKQIWIRNFPLPFFFLCRCCMKLLTSALGRSSPRFCVILFPFSSLLRSLPPSTLLIHQPTASLCLPVTLLVALEQSRGGTFKVGQVAAGNAESFMQTGSLWWEREEQDTLDQPWATRGRRERGEGQGERKAGDGIVEIFGDVAKKKCIKCVLKRRKKCNERWKERKEGGCISLNLVFTNKAHGCTFLKNTCAEMSLFHKNFGRFYEKMWKMDFNILNTDVLKTEFLFI